MHPALRVAFVCSGALLALACAGQPEPKPPTEASVPSEGREAEAEAGTVLDQLRGKPLAYTHHARCRMGCRDFTEEEVAHVLKTGSLDAERSRLDGDCPSHAVEGTTPDGQSARMVFGQCEDSTLVITAIDLGAEHDCDCD